jgi:hypothetical protein
MHTILYIFIINCIIHLNFGGLCSLLLDNAHFVDYAASCTAEQNLTFEIKPVFIFTEFRIADDDNGKCENQVNNKYQKELVLPSDRVKAVESLHFFALITVC